MKKYTLAFDFGGTKLATAIVQNDTGEISGYRKVATPAKEGADACLKAIVDTAKGSLSDANLVEKDMLGVGISFGGPVSADGKTVIRSMHVKGWDHYPLPSIISEAFDLPAFMGNDGNIAALGEWAYGSLRKPSYFGYVQISTGIGGGVIADRKLYQGNGLAVEVGHMKVPDAINARHTCACGSSGCIESIASGWAFARDAIALYQTAPSDSVFHKLIEAGNDFSAKTLIDAARNGDEAAKRIITNAFHSFADAMSNLIVLFDLEEIVIGGGIGSNAFDILGPILAENNCSGIPSDFTNRCSIRVSTLKGRETLLGAAELAKTNLRLS